MSFKQFAVPLHLDPRPSVLLRSAVAALHGLIGALTLVGGADRTATAMVFALLLLSLVSALFWIRRPVSLVWRADDKLEGTVWRSPIQDAEILPATFEHAKLVILHFREPDTGTRWRVPIAADSVDRDTMRRLRVRLRAANVSGKSRENA